MRETSLSRVGQSTAGRCQRAVRVIVYAPRRIGVGGNTKPDDRRRSLPRHQKEFLA